MTGPAFRLNIEGMKEAATLRPESARTRRDTSRVENARGRRSPFHVGLGVLAVFAIAAITVLVPSWGRLRLPALVRGAQVFSIASLEPGRYTCGLRSNREAGGSALVRQQLIEFERNDLVDLELEPTIVTGAEIEVGQRLAVVRSLRNEHRLQQLQAERDALLARRALLAAGGVPAEIEAAKTRVAVARAEHEAALTELERARALAAAGLISDLEFDALESEEKVCRLEVESSLAEVEVALDVARPEAITTADAEIMAIEANISELTRLVDERIVRSPINGIARIGAEDSEIEIHSVDTVYLAILMPGSKRTLAEPGTAVRFVSGGADGPVIDGEIVAIDTEITVVNGQAMVWVSAEIDNHPRSLRPGMTGVAEILADRRSPTLFATLTSLMRGDS